MSSPDAVTQSQSASSDCEMSSEVQDDVNCSSVDDAEPDDGDLSTAIDRSVTTSDVSALNNTADSVSESDAVDSQSDCVVIDDVASSQSSQQVVTVKGAQKRLVKKRSKLDGRAKLKEEMRRQSEELRKTKRAERELLKHEKKQERLKEKQEAFDKKEKERREKELDKLEKLREKEAEKQLKDKEREEKKKRKDEERQSKELVKQNKEEERRQKEEERKRELEEKERKLLKAQSMFSVFFSKSQLTPSTDVELPDQENDGDHTFMQFRVKEDMVLAPTVRRKLTDQEVSDLDTMLAAEHHNSTGPSYLEHIRTESYTPRFSGRTLPPVSKDLEIIDDDDDSVIDDIGTEQVAVSGDHCRKLRYKLLQFWENRRPAYWGTWRKRSRFVRPLCPLGKDMNLITYEEDSDDDWEDEDPDGESIDGSEKEIESEDDYEVDNEFFVPHGYLSDEEVMDEGELAMSPEAQKAKLKAKEEEFEKQLKKKTKALKPRLIGCVWQNENRDAAHYQLSKLLSAFSAMAFSSLPVSTGIDEGTAEDSTMNPLCTPDSAVSDNSPAQRGSKFFKEFPAVGLQSLAELVHGNIRGKISIIREFSAFWKQRSRRQLGNGAVYADSMNPSTPGKGSIDSAGNNPAANDVNLPSGADVDPAAADLGADGVENPIKEGSPRSERCRVLLSKRKIAEKLTEIGVYGRCTVEGPLLNRCCWMVKPEVVSSLSAVPPLPNRWKWITKTTRKTTCDLGASTSPAVVEGSPKSSPSVPEPQKRCRPDLLITKFTKVVTQKEVLDSIEVAVPAKPQPTNESQLQHVATSQKTKPVSPNSNSLITKFLKTATPADIRNDMLAPIPQKVSPLSVCNENKSCETEPVVISLDCEVEVGRTPLKDSSIANFFKPHTGSVNLEPAEKVALESLSGRNEPVISVAASTCVPLKNRTQLNTPKTCQPQQAPEKRKRRLTPIQIGNSPKRKITVLDAVFTKPMDPKE